MAIAEATPGWADDSAAVVDYRHMLAAAGYCLREKVADASAYLPQARRRIGLLRIRVDVAANAYLMSAPVP
eukprot:1770532-Alexandrium_andersonii.AAC.1